MSSSGPTISQQKIMDAAQGNASLREVLQQMAVVSKGIQSVTGTTPIVATKTPGKTNVSAPVPAQATGSFSVLAGNYIVQLVNPGGKSPLSQLQAAQAAQTLSPLQPVTPIYHQIRVSTSPAFNVNSNTQTFGGTTGSTQVYWTLTGLGSGTWYVQFRSSYDGINFNTWKNANGGSALGKLVDQVTLESAGISDWALFSVPGPMVMGVGIGLVEDQGIFPLAEQLYSSGMFAIAGPNGFSPNGNAVFGALLCDVDLQIPSGVTAGTPDYPVEIRMLYGVDSSTETVSGSANVFAICVDPTSTAVKFYPLGLSGNWAVIRLPGGARIAIGQGKCANGATIAVPSALTWISGTNMISICSLTDAIDLGVMTGYSQCQLSGLTMEANYLTPSNTNAPTTANWLAIAWEPGVDITTVGGNKFLTIPLQGGHAITIGAGQTASGTAISLPTGYTVDQMMSICTPGGSDNSGHHLRGVAECAMFDLIPILSYSDNTNNWSGAVNWMVAAWK